MRIKNNIKLESLGDGKYRVGSGKREIESWVVIFRHEESEFRLLTNLANNDNEKGGVSDEDVADIYKKRWQIELFWKFLNIHLKLNRLITKNVNDITIQIYASIIGYLILKLLEIPREAGKTMLDKLRYLQAFMCERISYVHWLKELVLSD